MYSSPTLTSKIDYKIIGNLWSSYPIGSNVVKNHNNIKILEVELNRYLVEEGIETDKVVLVGTGSSGIILCTLLHLYLPNSIILHIKKESENSHSHHSNIYEDFDGKTLIFVDDFMCSGDTYSRVYKEVKKLGLTIFIACFIGSVRERVLNNYPVDVVFCTSKE